MTKLNGTELIWEVVLRKDRRSETEKERKFLGTSHESFELFLRLLPTITGKLWPLELIWLTTYF